MCRSGDAIHGGRRPRCLIGVECTALPFVYAMVVCDTMSSAIKRMQMERAESGGQYDYLRDEVARRLVDRIKAGCIACL